MTVRNAHDVCSVVAFTHAQNTDFIFQPKRSLRCCPKSKTEQRELVAAENSQIFKFQYALTAFQKVDVIVTPHNA